MKRILFAALVATLPAVPASAATRTFSVTSFDRIRVDGPYAVTLTVGGSSSAQASGSPQALDGVRIAVEGRTMVIRPSPSGWGGYPGKDAGPIEIRVGTPQLSSALLNGNGSLAINRVKGLQFTVSAQGAGSIAIDSVEVDRLSAGLNGAVTARFAGKVLKFTAQQEGTTTLDAAALSAKDVAVTIRGPSTTQVQATATAKVDVSGTAQVTVTGGAPCTVKAFGSASVTGCR